MRTRIAPVVVVLLVVASLTAQGIRPGITGIVTDTSGAALPGVTVTVDGPVSRSAVTDSRGAYTLANLPPGVYDVRFVLAGFLTMTRRITVTDARIERVVVALQVGSLSETITITGTGERAAAQTRATGIVGGTAGDTGGGRPAVPAPPAVEIRRGGRPFNTEAYDHRDENPFRRVTAEPLSTFSVDVDTASYANVRRFLNQGQLPEPGAVRIEELINYFRFDYPRPQTSVPFAVTTALSECPWNPRHSLALIGVQGRDVEDDDPSPRNLVFLLDVSGSMAPDDKLPLLKQSMRMLVDILTGRDRVAIVVYAGESGLALPSTPGDRKAVINHALAELHAGGSTNGASGIELAYRVARDHFIEGGVNRVILATDGDFNVGVTSQDALVKLIERERESGIFLSVLGVGTGNLKDSTMEKLADHGNGNYAYLDSLQEARKVLVKEAGATLNTIAKDVKIQVEFNPAAVGAYRLIGYENRLLRNEDFNNDRKDAGDIGAGHSVTALYEIVPPGEDVDAPSVDPLKYQRPQRGTVTASRDELMTVKVRYKEPDGRTSRLVSSVVRNQPRPLDRNLGFASAVAEVGMLLNDSQRRGHASYESAITRARTFLGSDDEGYRTEFVALAERAAHLSRHREQ
jgi:Ca-activated chloride channel homolog